MASPVKRSASSGLTGTPGQRVWVRTFNKRALLTGPGAGNLTENTPKGNSWTKREAQAEQFQPARGQPWTKEVGVGSMRPRDQFVKTQELSMEPRLAFPAYFEQGICFEMFSEASTCGKK